MKYKIRGETAKAITNALVDYQDQLAVEIEEAGGDVDMVRGYKKKMRAIKKLCNDFILELGQTAY